MADQQKVISDAMAKEIAKSIDKEAKQAGEMMEDLITGEIWKPDHVKKKYLTDNWRRELYNDWEDVQRSARDPVQKLRDEMMEELRDIKKAMRKMGIMLDSEAPTEEQLRKHKMLRDAYKKYKMIERLVLGNEVKEAK